MWSQSKKHNLDPEQWVERYKEKATGSKAIYIDLEDDRDDDENRIYSQWSLLPDLALEKIFSFLNIREKYYASLVCRNWYRAIHMPMVWSRFVLEDNTLTRSRFNYYCGWQYVLDHVRCQACLLSVGKHFRHLIIDKMFNFYNLYEFMNMVSWFNEQKSNKFVEVGVGRNIKLLKFTFPCDMMTTSSEENVHRLRLFGTGGKLLQALKRLMGHLKKLENLQLIDLMLEPNEAQFLLDEVAETCQLTLKSLNLMNVTKVQYQLLHVGIFLNLQELYISPQNLADDLMELISYTNLKHLHIVQNKYTPSDINIKPVSESAWKKCKECNPNLNVHLQLQCFKEKKLIWQKSAPVRTLLFDSPYIGLKTDMLESASDYYNKYLRIYGHLSIPRLSKPKSFIKRIDQDLITFLHQCRHLSTMIINERISTATVLLLASQGRNLKRLFIRRNAVIKRMDWSRSPDWTSEFYSWLKDNARSYDLVELEVTKILNYRWKFLTDKEFKNLKVNLHDF